MDYKDIEQLLERYWQCETSVEEEATLRDFFAKEEVPAHLLRYKNLFVYQQVQQEVTADRQAVPGQVVHPGRPQQHGIGQNIQHALLHLLLVAAIDVGGGERCILVKRPVLSKARVDLVRAERNQLCAAFCAAAAIQHGSRTLAR